MLDRLLPPEAADALPVWIADRGTLDKLPEPAAGWAARCEFRAANGEVLLVPGEGGKLLGAVLGLAARKGEDPARLALSVGTLAKALPRGNWRLVEPHSLDPELAGLGFLLGGYRFDRYRRASKPSSGVCLVAGADVDRQEQVAVATAVSLARDLINTPANDMGPDALEAAARAVAEASGAEVAVTTGEALLGANLPMIHAVGRASATPPRLIDFSHGRPDAPKVTLVGKGVCFDTGGLDIKPSSGMLLMKKDMGGAANVLALAQLIMGRKLDVRLRVLIPAVENSISGSAFRPSDILPSRNGKTVEVGNTDAEGRLVLADALALADEEAPHLLIDMATLTGAARVALGPELPPFFTDDEALAVELARASSAVGDPIWRLPLWRPYAANLESKVADTNNVTSDGFAGSITAALFLQGFVEKAVSWAHFDIYGWRPKPAPTGPVGGEAQAIRAIYRVLRERYGAA